MPEHSNAPRKIIHLDLDAFYCAVEEQLDPSLCGKPFAVGGRPEERGVVSSCSYAARRMGVRSAMPMSRALKLCPGLGVISPHYASYKQTSQRVMLRLHQFASQVEQISIDEAFLDVSESPESAEILARQIQTDIRNHLNLPCSLGIATNKLVAKIATDVGKAAAQSGSPPNAITIVPPGCEQEFLALLSVQALWGVGPKTAQRLAESGVLTIGELADFPLAELVRLFGKNGYQLSLHAHGLDNRPISTYHEPKSISQETTFARDISDPERLLHTLHTLSSDVAIHLSNINRKGTTIKLKLRWPDFTTLTRQITLREPTDNENQIYAAASQLFQKVWHRGKAVRLIGVGVSSLCQPSEQLTLWEGIDNE